MNRCLRSRETLSLHFVQLNKFYFDKNIVVHNKYITVCLFQIQSQSVGEWRKQKFHTYLILSPFMTIFTSYSSSYLSKASKQTTYIINNAFRFMFKGTNNKALTKMVLVCTKSLILYVLHAKIKK